jgi:hypothetical protein
MSIVQKASEKNTKFIEILALIITVCFQNKTPSRISHSLSEPIKIDHRLAHSRLGLCLGLIKGKLCQI